MQATRILTTAAALLAIWAVTGAQAQMDATFTYQGYLESNGEPANYSGAAMTFELYDVDSGGTSLGTLNLSEVLVEDGTFIVALDFGADVFDGSDRWLAITVEGTLLSPRQRITATPHATLAGTLAVPALLQSDSDYTLRIEGDGILAGNVLEVYANPDAGNVKSALRATFAPNLNTAKLGNPAAAIWGQAHSGSALLAEHIPTGNTVTLGNGTYGVYSHVTDPANWAGWFEGRSYFSDAVGIGTDTPEDASLHVVSTGRRGVRVHTTDGIYCVSGEAWGTTAVSVQGYHHGVGVGVRGHSGSGVGVYGISQSDLGVRGFNLSTDTIGYLAGPDYAVYGEHPDGGFAGYFDGNLYASGNVGIGTTTPTEALTVAGTVESTAGGFKFPDGTVQTTASTGGGDSPWDQFGSNIYYNDGNVGIGTSFPDTQLELRSDRAWMRLTSMTHTSGSIIEMQSKIPGNTTLGAINFMDDLGSTRSQINGQTGALLLHALDEYGTLKTRLTLDDDGHVGIGTTTPTEALTVVGTVESTAGGFKFPDGTVQTTAASGGSGGYWNENGSDIYYSNGNVGIGTSTPSENLVVGEDLGANYNGNRIVIGDATSGADTGLVVGEGADERGYLLWNVGESIFRLGSVVGGVSHSNTLVLNEGNVGIGTSAPGGVFHASGGDSGGSAWYDTYDFIFENDNHSVVNIVAPPEYKSEIAFSDTVRGRGAIRYVHSDDAMDFRTGGVNGRMVIDAGGNVGIGTSAPEAQLHVAGAGNQILIGNTNHADQPALRLLGGQSSGYAYIQAGGSGGAPAKLRITKYLSAYDELDDLHIAATNIRAGYGGNLITDGIIGATISGGGAADSGGGPSEKNFVDDDYCTIGGGIGNQVGVHDFGHEVCTYGTVGGGRYNIVVGDSSTIGGGESNITLSFDATIGGGAANEAGSSATVAGGAQNKAIGTWSAIAGGALNEADGNAAIIPGGYDCEAGGHYSFAAGRRAKVLEGHDGTFVWADSTDADFTSDTDNQFLIRASGGVGIGTSLTYGYDLVVDGSAAKPGGGFWSAYSDRRLKSDITPLCGALDRLLKLRGYEFEYTDDAIQTHLGRPGRQIGLIAQEVQEVFPDWVEEDTDGYLSVSQRGTTALVVEALRELRAEKDAQIEAQRVLIAEQRGQIADLNERLLRLEARMSECTHESEGD